MIPYSAEVFFAILAEYNSSIWPAQAVALLLGVTAVFLVARFPARAGRPVAALLAGAWGWTGLVYFLAEFSEIDFWAYGFGAAFVLQGLGFVWAGLIRRRLRFGSEPNQTVWSGAGLVALGLLGYPLLVAALGRDLLETGAFGVAPGPTVIFTLGVLLAARPAAPLYLFAVPLIWCVIAGGVAIQLGIHEELTVAAAGVAAIIVLMVSRARR